MNYVGTDKCCPSHAGGQKDLSAGIGTESCEQPSPNVNLGASLRDPRIQKRMLELCQTQVKPEVSTLERKEEAEKLPCFKPGIVEEQETPTLTLAPPNEKMEAIGSWKMKEVKKEEVSPPRRPGTSKKAKKEEVSPPRSPGTSKKVKKEEVSPPRRPGTSKEVKKEEVSPTRRSGTSSARPSYEINADDVLRAKGLTKRTEVKGKKPLIQGLSLT